MMEIAGPENVLTRELDKYTYSYDSSFHSSLVQLLPEIVVKVKSTAVVSSIMKYAFANEIPVTPRGAGSGQTGGSVPASKGILLDLSCWDTIEEIDAKNMQVVVRPGVVHANLNQALAPYNLFFPPDPGSTKMATIGGMVSNNSSGLRAVKYGNTGQYVLGLEVVLPDGEVIITGGLTSKALKSVSGIDLTKLFVGAEGTCGIITRVRLKVLPKPAARGLLTALFDKLEDSGETVLEVFKAGILPSGIEILDDAAIKAANLYKPGLNIPAAEAMLLFEIDGNQPSVEHEGMLLQEIVKKRAKNVEWATEKARMAKLWEARGVIGSASARVKEGATRIFAGEDITIPLENVPKALRRIKEIAQKYSIIVVIYGHVGDGNMHTAPIIDPTDANEVQKTLQLADEIHRLAIELGGSTTGEHGVGIVRRPYMREEHGNALDVMFRLKKTLDSKGIMNPGKIWPLEGE
ncbi:MAG: FAD-linked oxidase C-terminal domain-containing protein [Bacillota bacterium]